MPKKLKVADSIQQKLGNDWNIQVQTESFTGGKGAKMPSLGFPCGVCASQDTKLHCAESTDEEESKLLWIEVQCRACKQFTKYEVIKR